MKILYGASVARYDLLRPVQALASKITKWTKLCDRKLHRLSYINETVQICLHAWVGDPIERIKMVLYCDADLASDRNDHKSTSGVFLCLMGPQTFVPIAAYCQRQTSVSKSTPEAEVVALHDGLTKQGIPGLVLWEEVKGQSVNLTVAEDNQAAVRIIISGKNPNMRYLSRTQRVDIARLNQFYEEKLFTFVDCPTEYQAANMMTKAICDAREWMRELQTTGHFAPDHLGEIIKGSAAAPAERGVSQNSESNGSLPKQLSNEADDDRWPSWIDTNLSKREGEGLHVSERESILFVRGAKTGETRILADDARCGEAAAVAIFAPNRDIPLLRHQKSRGPRSETRSKREQSALFAVARVMKLARDARVPVILVKHEESFMPSRVFRHLCERSGLVRISSKPTLIGCPGESMDRLDSCHIAHAMRDCNYEESHSERRTTVAAKLPNIKGEVDYFTCIELVARHS